jgi:hypothetical protein
MLYQLSYASLTVGRYQNNTDEGVCVVPTLALSFHRLVVDSVFGRVSGFELLPPLSPPHDVLVGPLNYDVERPPRGSYPAISAGIAISPFGVTVLSNSTAFIWTPDAWSGRRESDPRPTAWKAVTLPLSYSRPESNQSHFSAGCSDARHKWSITPPHQS